MISELHIQGLGVIDDAVLDLSPGLTVVTGETGAGKTMVVTGLGLLLGGRADAGAVRTGGDRALVEGRIHLSPGSTAHTRYLDVGADLDDDDVALLARSVSAEGRSRAWAGGRSVPVGLLAELADDLVAVHGQSDQQRLLQPARQRAALDRYAGDPVAAALSDYRRDYARLRDIDAELGELTATASERAADADRLRFGLAEINAVGPLPGEDAALDAEAEKLANADDLRTAADLAHQGLLGAPEDSGAGPAADALTMVVAARRVLDQARSHDPALGGLADRLAEVAALMSDAGADIASYAAAVDADPLRLAAVQDRRAALKSLTRKYGTSVDAVLQWAADADKRLGSLDTDQDRIGELHDERTSVRGRLAAAAHLVSQARAEAGQRFAAAVTAELADLAMPHAAVTVTASTTPAEPDTGLRVDGHWVAFGPHGVDEVEFTLAPHPGAPARPLARGASGGELSRVMLAVEVVFAGADPVPTMVFDEVDAGVGGRAAVEVGRRLARLARSAQVLVVTHLPQVAAFADVHVMVAKASDGAVTRSGIHTLDGPGRIGELTRMLAGLDHSDTGRAHAEELLAAATAFKDT